MFKVLKEKDKFLKVTQENINEQLNEIRLLFGDMKNFIAEMEMLRKDQTGMLEMKNIGSQNVKPVILPKSIYRVNEILTQIPITITQKS